MAPSLAILQFLRYKNFEPEVFFTLGGGFVAEQGHPVVRGKMFLTVEQLHQAEHRLSEPQREALRSFLLRHRPSHILLNNRFFEQIDDEIRAVLPQVQIAEYNLFRSTLSPRALLRWVTGQGEFPDGRDPLVYYEEFYRTLYEQHPRPLVAWENLSPEVAYQESFDGDLFIDHLCHHRTVSRDEAHPVMSGTRACSFCQIPLLAKPLFPPDYRAVVGQVAAYLAEFPRARSFRLSDGGFTARCVSFAEALAEAPFSGLEFALELRIGDILRHREKIERCLELLRCKGHVLNFFCIGFETFSAQEFSRLHKGFEVTRNIEGVLYLAALERRFPETFTFTRRTAHGFISFTPWTRLADLRENLRWDAALNFDRLTGKYFLRKMRFMDYLPLTRAAEAAGLLVGQYEDYRFDAARRQLYEQEIPWRFADPQVERLCAWLYRLALPDSTEEQAASRQLEQAVAASRTHLRPWYFFLFAALIAEAEHLPEAQGPLPAEFLARLQARMTEPLPILLGWEEGTPVAPPVGRGRFLVGPHGECWECLAAEPAPGVWGLAHGGLREVNGVTDATLATALLESQEVAVLPGALLVFGSAGLTAAVTGQSWCWWVDGVPQEVRPALGWGTADPPTPVAEAAPVPALLLLPEGCAEELTASLQQRLPTVHLVRQTATLAEWRLILSEGDLRLRLQLREAGGRYLASGERLGVSYSWSGDAATPAGLVDACREVLAEAESALVASFR